jgi:hypothetical protein
MASYPADRRLSLDLREAEPGHFEVLKVDASKPSSPDADGLVRQAVRLEVVPFDLGPMTFPELAWTLTAPSGSTETLKSPRVRITVSGPEPGEDIADIKPPLRGPAWPFILAAALAAGAGWLAWNRYRRRHPAAVPGAAPPDNRPPHVRALEKLDAGGGHAADLHVVPPDLPRQVGEDGKRRHHSQFPHIRLSRNS